MNKKEILQKAEIKIQEEMNRIGYIDDSDNVVRFLDNLARNLAEEEVLKGNEDIDYEKEREIEELQEELLEEIKKIMSSKYKRIYSLKNGHYTAFYYETEIDKEFNNLDEFNDYFGIGE